MNPLRLLLVTCLLLSACRKDDGSGNDFESLNVDTPTSFEVCCENPPMDVGTFEVENRGTFATAVEISPSDIFCLRHPDGSSGAKVSVDTFATTTLTIVVKQCFEGTVEATVRAVNAADVTARLNTIRVTNTCPFTPPEPTGEALADLTANNDWRTFVAKFHDFDAKARHPVEIETDDATGQSSEDGTGAFVGPALAWSPIRVTFDGLTTYLLPPLSARYNWLPLDLGYYYIPEKSDGFTLTVTLPANSNITAADFTGQNAEASATVETGTDVSGVNAGGSVEITAVPVDMNQMHFEGPGSFVPLGGVYVFMPEGVKLTKTNSPTGDLVIPNRRGLPAGTPLRTWVHNVVFGWQSKSQLVAEVVTTGIRIRGGLAEAALLCVTAGLGNQTTLVGEVQDEQGQPLANAEVRAETGERGRTDRDGKWTLTLDMPVNGDFSADAKLHVYPPAAGSRETLSLTIPGSDIVLGGDTDLGIQTVTGSETGSIWLTFMVNGESLRLEDVQVRPKFDPGAAWIDFTTDRHGGILVSDFEPGEYEARQKGSSHIQDFRVIADQLLSATIQRSVGSGTGRLDAVVLNDTDHNPATPPVFDGRAKVELHMKGGEKLVAFTNKLGIASFEAVGDLERIVGSTAHWYREQLVTVAGLAENPVIENNTTVLIITNRPADLGPDSVNALFTIEVANYDPAETMSVFLRRAIDNFIPVGEQSLGNNGTVSIGYDSTYQWRGVMIGQSNSSAPWLSPFTDADATDDGFGGAELTIDRAGNRIFDLTDEVEAAERGTSDTPVRGFALGWGDARWDLDRTDNPVRFSRSIGNVMEGWLWSDFVTVDLKHTLITRDVRSQKTKFEPLYLGIPDDYRVIGGPAGIDFVFQPTKLGFYAASIEFSDGSFYKGYILVDTLSETKVVFPADILPAGATVVASQLVCGGIVREPDELTLLSTIPTLLHAPLWDRGSLSMPRLRGIPPELFARADPNNLGVDPLENRRAILQAACEQLLLRGPAAYGRIELAFLRFILQSLEDDYAHFYYNERPPN